MDPLSVTASVLAIIGALRAVTKGYKTIADLGKAPQEFRDLISELESIHDYIGMLHSVLGMGSGMQAFAAVDLTSLGIALSRLEDTIQELQSALKQVEKDSKTSESGHRVSKMKWQVYKPKVAQLRDEVRHRKQDLADKIGLLQLALGVLHTSLLSTAYVKAEVSYTRHNDLSSGEPQSTVLLNNNQDRALKPGLQNRTPRCCAASCLCRCHRPSTSNYHPWLLSTTRQLLSLFATSSYWESSICDDPVCREVSQQKLALIYQIPLFHYAFSLRLVWTSTFGPAASFHLRVARVVPRSLVFLTAASGTVQQMKYLFEKRRVLPNDMDERGGSLLLIASIKINEEMIDYLLEVGADAFQSDFYGISPMSTLQHYRRCNPTDSYLSSKLQLVVEDKYNSSLPEYPLHDVVATGTSAEIQLVLDKYPSLVNQPAELGFTPLHLAVVLGNRDSTIELLLSRGSDSRKQDLMGRTPLHYAVQGHCFGIVEQLVSLTGDCNILDRYGDSPLDTAVLCSSSKIVSLLLSAGIEPGKRRCYGSSDPFVKLAFRKRDDLQDEDDLEAIMRHLLNTGLDFEDNGGLACAVAAGEDNHLILKVLLKLGAKISQKNGEEFGILHMAANYATLDTIEVLRQANIKGIDPDEEDDDGWTAMELFEDRETCPDEALLPRQTRPTAEEFIAFRALINEIRERNDSERNVRETNDLGDNKSEKDDTLLGNVDGKEADEQVPLPGAWVE
ncbi:ankyrin [Xylariaceae sp. AK1471]|nr:ankyrin [Xylariaceae sp. AK1471]